MISQKKENKVFMKKKKEKKKQLMLTIHFLKYIVNHCPKSIR